MDRFNYCIPYILSGLGILLLIQTLGEGMYVLFISNPLGIVWVVGVIAALPFNLVLVYSGYWVSTSSLSIERYKRIALWASGGLGIFIIFNAVLMVTLPMQNGGGPLPPRSSLLLVSWGRWAATLGAGTGTIVGIFEGISIEKAVKAERERVRAEEAENRETFLSYINATLRHEVLNTATVILGRTEQLATESQGARDIPEYVATIKKQTREMEAVIDDIRLLLSALKEETETRPLDVTGLLADEIATVEESMGPVEIETSMPSKALVRADTPLRRAFANLLRNAVEHNDSDIPQIAVIVETDDDTVRVRIADNGPGIPATEREMLFEVENRTDSKHGLGLPLTKTIVEGYNGAIELTETGSDGTTFTIELPSVSQKPSER